VKHPSQGVVMVRRPFDAVLLGAENGSSSGRIPGRKLAEERRWSLIFAIKNNSPRSDVQGTG